MKDINHHEESIEDPVARSAFEEAIARTDTKESPHPRTSIMIIVLAFVIAVIGAFGAIIGSINYVTLVNENATLKAEISCTTQLVGVLETETNQRSAIAKQDRSVLDDLVNSIQVSINSGNSIGINKAFATYHRERTRNERIRSALPPLPTPAACTSGPLKPSKSTSPLSTSPNASPSGSAHPSASPTPSSSVTHAGGPAPKVSTVVRTSAGRTVTRTRPAQPPVTRTATKTASAPPTATHTPKPSPTSIIVICPPGLGCVSIPPLPI